MKRDFKIDIDPSKVEYHIGFDEEQTFTKFVLYPHGRHYLLITFTDAPFTSGFINSDDLERIRSIRIRERKIITEKDWGFKYFKRYYVCSAYGKDHMKLGGTQIAYLKRDKLLEFLLERL
ncbi:MAG TPA: hypothetical protein P5136_01095 [Methanofastidiosum sp.]|nr:hypothetical protein [Methanofastidiosum sp.]